MSESTVSVPLLESGEHGEEGSRVRWWNKVLDVEETKNQVLFSLPLILSNVFYYLITLVSVMFAGHLGDLELAGATLANSWAVVTGFAFMVGLSGSLETLCGQGFGGKVIQNVGDLSTSLFHHIFPFLYHHISLGFKGAPLAASISLWISILMLAILEYLAFEILVLLAGLMPNSELTTSLIAMCVNTEAIAYMITYGLSAAASTRVSNELGAGNPDRAKNAMAVTLKLSVLLGFLVVLGASTWSQYLGRLL
ncbi:hypothetical protein M0R45_014814 [Rubus argutus]|uniref:Uncharacterized protein n=1 Tax=Rubus argutus TaxID=59490 RepID=A0AAW1XQ12_RUBAR